MLQVNKISCQHGAADAHAPIDLRRACIFSVTCNGQLVPYFSCLSQLRYPVAARDRCCWAVNPAVTTV